MKKLTLSFITLALVGVSNVTLADTLRMECRKGKQCNRGSARNISR